MKFYPHHISDFNNATRHLSRLERSLYREMLDLYYETEAPLTVVEQALNRRLTVVQREEIEACNTVLNEFFIRTENGWVNRRCEEEIARFRLRKEAASKAGKASASSRKNGRSTDSQRSLNGCSTDVQPTINHKPITKKDKKVPKKFVPPTLDDCKAYQREQCHLVDAELFFSFYHPHWTDSQGNAVKNWKAKMNTWNQREKSKPSQNHSQKPINGYGIDPLRSKEEPPEQTPEQAAESRRLIEEMAKKFSMTPQEVYEINKKHQPQMELDLLEYGSDDDGLPV